MVKFYFPQILPLISKILALYCILIYIIRPWYETSYIIEVLIPKSSLQCESRRNFIFFCALSFDSRFRVFERISSVRKVERRNRISRSCCRRLEWHRLRETWKRDSASWIQVEQLCGEVTCARVAAREQAALITCCQASFLPCEANAIAIKEKKDIFFYFLPNVEQR